jgi:protein TonB
MQNIENKQTATFNHLALGNLSIARLSISVVAGGIITFALFAAMHALIDQGNVRPPPEKPIVLVSSILDIPEEKLIVRPTIKPLPEITLQPVTRVELPQDPSGTSSFSEAIEIPSIGTEKLAFVIGAVDQQPRPIVRFNPKYPGPAASDGIEGFVSLSFGVSTSGEVVDIKIVETEPKNTFERAAKQALRKWRYQPKMVNGSPVGMDGLQVRLDFSLANN